MRQTSELREVSTLITKGTTPSSVGKQFTTKGINFVKSESICDSKYLNPSVFTKIDAETDIKLKRSRLKEGDLLFSIAGAYLGKISIVRKKDLPANTNQAVGIVRIDKSKADVHYLYYFFSQSNVNKYINNLSAQSSQPNLNLDLLGRLVFNYIDIVEQRKIANVLSSIDQKIELNNQINTELEAMAKTLYNYWFVQFDFPNTEGKPYKSSGGKMVYNKVLKREIPEGWEVKVLADIATTGSGGTPLSSKKEYYANGNIPWINSGELNTPFIVSTSNFITKLGLENSNAKLFKKNTILMAMYGATAGKVSFIDFPSATNQAICGINPIDQDMNVYLKFNLERLYQYLVNLSSGSARDNLSQDKIKNLDIVIPSDYILTRFDNMVNRKMQLIINNIKQNQELERLRDWLLPMLMNGQVTVK